MQEKKNEHNRLYLTKFHTICFDIVPSIFLQQISLRYVMVTY